MSSCSSSAQLLDLPTRFLGALPRTTIVDLRGRKEAGAISLQLRERLEETLRNGRQAILFLNRRGAAGSLLCRDCGTPASCPTCEIPLALHGFGERARLICHHCGRILFPSRKCSKCGGANLLPAGGAGTEAVERELCELFPAARIARADRDTTSRKNSHAELFAKMEAGEIDFLVGTQMIAKGLDLPGVSLVGILLADIGLHRPDFRAPERVFQLLVQVAGRAGRRDAEGEVLIQTLSPESSAIRHGARQDFRGFAEEELKRRKAAGFPPFAELVRLELRAPEKGAGFREAEELAASLKKKSSAVEILGPAPAFPPKKGRWYRVQLLLRGNGARQLAKKAELPRKWRVILEG